MRQGAQIIDMPVIETSGSNDPVQKYFELERQKNESRKNIWDAEAEQRQLRWENRSNPEFQQFFSMMPLSDQQFDNMQVESISEFFGGSGPKPLSTETRTDAAEELSKEERIRRAADASFWSPRLKELVQKKTERRRKRILQGDEAMGPTVVLGEGLSSEEIRYYAEDVNLEYYS